MSLSRREFDILELLSLSAGQVFDRERIYETVWGIDGEGNSDTVMEHIRRSLEDKLCATKDRARKVTQALGVAQKIVSWIPDIGQLEFNFCF